MNDTDEDRSNLQYNSNTSPAPQLPHHSDPDEQTVTSIAGQADAKRLTSREKRIVATVLNEVLNQIGRRTDPSTSIAKLSTDVYLATKDIETAQGDRAKLQGNLNSLEGEVRQLQSESSANTLRRLQDENKTLKNELNKAKESMSKLEKAHKSLKTEMDSLKSSITLSESRLTALEDRTIQDDSNGQNVPHGSASRALRSQDYLRGSGPPRRSAYD